MSKKGVLAKHIARGLWSAAVAGAVDLAAAQSSAPAASGGPSDPNPYYIGVAEALTHDSNVFRVPGGRSDNLSSTSLRAGFLQPISRQRVFGAASVSVNRYQDTTTLNNTSYALSAGANWESGSHLSGDLDASMGRNLSAPTVNATSLAAVRNVADSRNLDAAVRWGGMSLLTLQADAGWSRYGYSGQGGSAADARQSRAGLGAYVRPGGPLTLGLAGRFNRTESPQAFGAPQGAASDTVEGRNLDFLVGYEVTGAISANGRLSYTRQTSGTVAAQEFSGLTGGVSVNWRPTQKTSVHVDASRDAGSGSGLFGATAVTLPVSGAGTTIAPAPATVTTPSNVVYENNRLTDSYAVGASLAASSKISVSVNARYSRARIVAGSAPSAAGPTGANTTDESKLASLGATYAFTRYWNFDCSVSREWRDVGGGVNFAYQASVASCSTQLTLR